MHKIILGTIMIVLFFSGCGKKEINQQELITEYVKNNQTKLIEVVNKINLQEVEEETMIKELPKDIKISDIYKSEQYDYIDFGIDEGFTTPSHYYGFYYSPINEAKTIMPVSGEKVEFENSYRIQEEGNEDWYYTEKILDNFYFYEAHY